MKGFCRTIFLFANIALFSTCSDDFFTKYPQGEDSENIFRNEKGIDALLTGTYAMLDGSALWQISWGLPSRTGLTVR